MSVHQRTRRPLERGITWLPRHDSYHVVASMLVSSRGADPVCVTQELLCTLESQMRHPGSGWSYGLLSGRLCVCPKSRRHYLLLERHHPCPPCDDGADAFASMAVHLNVQSAHVERAGRAPLGCYLRWAAEGQIASGALALFRALFPDPWHVLLAHDGAESGGALLRIEPVHLRTYYVPFVELLPPPRWRERRRPPRSAIAWVDYCATEALAEGLVTPTAAEGGLLKRHLGDVVHTLVGRRDGDASTALQPTTPQSATAQPTATPPELEVRQTADRPPVSVGRQRGVRATPVIPTTGVAPRPVFRPSPVANVGSTPPPAEAGGRCSGNGDGPGDEPAISDAPSRAAAARESVVPGDVATPRQRDELAATAHESAPPAPDDHDGEPPIVAFPFVMPPDEHDPDGRDMEGREPPPTSSGSWMRRIRRFAGLG